MSTSKKSDTEKKKKKKEKEKELDAKVQKAEAIINERPDQLSERDEAFCHFYLDCKENASEAFRMVTDTSDWKVESVWTEACRLRNKPKVDSRINELRKARRMLSEVKRERCEQVLMNIINNKPSDSLYKSPTTGKMRKRSPFQMSEETEDAIESMNIDTKGNFTYKYHSKLEAIKTLGKWNGWEAPTELHHTSDLYGEEIGIMPEELDEYFDREEGLN